MRKVSVIGLVLMLVGCSYSASAATKLGSAIGFNEAHQGVWYDVQRPGVYVSLITRRAFTVTYNTKKALAMLEQPEPPMTKSPGPTITYVFALLDKLPGQSAGLAATAYFYSFDAYPVVTSDQLITTDKILGQPYGPGNYDAHSVGTMRVYPGCEGETPIIDMLVSVGPPYVNQSYQFRPLPNQVGSICANTAKLRHK